MTYGTRPDGYRPFAGERKRVRKRWNKWLLGFGLALMISYAALVLVFPDKDALPPAGLYLPLILGAAFSPFARANWLTSRGRARYDEFERNAYAHAAVIAYALFVCLILITFLYLVLADVWGWPVPRTASQWTIWLVVALFTALYLPLLVAEIIVPMPPTANPEDDLP